PAEKDLKKKHRYQADLRSFATTETTALPEVDPDALAYVIYTSGSTGQPKGCLITHRNVIRLMKNDRHPFAFGPDDTWVMAHAYNFDFSVWEMYGAILYGGRLVIPDRSLVKDVEAFRKLVSDERITVLNQTPLAFYYFIEAERKQEDHTLGEHLRYVVFGGDRLDFDKLAEWTDLYPAEQISLVNMYGITETTVHVTHFEVTDEHVHSKASGSIIGRPIPETTIFVLNEQMNIQPVGIAGELYVGGTGVCKGYLNRPDLTKERFLENPFVPDTRLYRTGDRGKWLPDGNLEFLGRVDDQVKIRGYRIEPKEIEARLKAHSGVEGMAVHVVDLPNGDKALQAVFSLSDDHGHPVRQLLQYRQEDPELYQEALKLPNGLVLFSSDHQTDRQTYSALFDNFEMSENGIHLRSGDRVVDLNPGSGMLTLFSALSYDDIIIHSVTDTNESARKLRVNHELYAIDASVYELDQGDLSNTLTVLFPDEPHAKIALLRCSALSGILTSQLTSINLSVVEQIIIDHADSEGDNHDLTEFLRSEGFAVNRQGTAIYGSKRNRVKHELPARIRFNGNYQWTDINELIKSLQAFGHEELAAYMVPDLFKVVERIPLTTNGKLDKKALAKLPDLSSDTAGNYTAPRTDTEVKLERIWAEVLGVEKLSVTDNFFEMGGHSLRATRVLSRIHEQFDIRLRLNTFFEQPTIEKLAATIGASETHLHRPVRPVLQSEHYPASYAQQRMWVLSQFDGADTAYNIFGVFDLTGDLRHEVLQKAITLLVSRHEALRTVFRQIDGEVRQVILPADESVYYYEFRKPDSTGSGQDGAEWLSEESNFVFDLKKGPLLRVRLIQRAEKSFTLIMNMHHIISDAWSLNLLMREVALLYNSLSQGKEIPFQPLTIHYKDYASWQNEQLSGKVLESHQQYWWGIFDTAPVITGLATDYQRPAQKTYNGRSIQHKLDKSVISSLNNLATRQGASLFMVLLSTVKALLYRYTNQDDLTIGTTIAGRDHRDLEGQVGFFVNSLAIRTLVDSGETFESLVTKVRDRVLGAYDHQLYPFDRLVNDLNLPRDVSRSPVFDILVELINVTGSEGSVSLNEVEVTPRETDYVVSKFDLTFRFVEDRDDMVLVLEYNTDLYAADRMKALLGHYDQLLTEVCRNAFCPLQVIDLIPAGERANYYPEEMPEQIEASDTHRTVAYLFDQAALENPDKTALVFGEHTLSYAELDRQSRNLAAHLIEEFDLRPENTVAIWVERSPEVIIAMLGIIRAGAAFLPIDTSYPRERVGYMLSESGAAVLLTTSDRLFDLGDIYQGNVFGLDIQLDTLPEATIKLPAPTAGHIAYLIFTSGSTGQPKGVAVEHGNLFNYINWASRFYFDTKPDQPAALFTSLSFDLTITSIFSTLTRGDKLVIMPEEGIRETLEKIFSPGEAVVKMVKMTPSHVDVLSQTDLINSEVRTVVLGGEAVRSSHLKTLFGLNPDMAMYNEYGPTETTVGCSVSRLSLSDEVISIGKPIDNTYILALDTNRNLLPDYLPGELYIGGAGVARGYINKPDLTADRFITDPFNAKGKLYTSGDLGYRTPEGDWVLLGRVDEQIKLNGFRIEPGEIISTLLLHEDVEQAFVTTNGNGTERQLIGYYTGREVDAKAMRTHMSQHLPDYMVPDLFIWVDSFTLTANGKIDRKALPVPGKSAGLEKAEFVAPRNENEIKLAGIWQAVLGEGEIGIYNNFFELGGQSLKGIQVLSRVAEEFNVTISLTELFNHPTIAELVPVITSSVNGIVQNITPVPKAESYAVSHAQQRLWVLNDLGHDEGAYNIPGGVAFGGE
ncbi:MAG: amino acid adenylation domain-containing protein, partial [Cyclobacteriaceae bacterium]